jgi:hypothetical protein
MERKNLEERVEQAVDEMRAHVEDLEQRRDAIEHRSEEARRETQRLEEASPGTKALKDDDEDSGDEEPKDEDKDAGEETSPKDG